jgi:hypothetical protein
MRKAEFGKWPAKETAGKKTEAAVAKAMAARGNH